MTELILTLNAGSSSIKFAVFEPGQTAQEPPQERLRGQVEEIGTAPRLKAAAGGETVAERAAPEAGDHRRALRQILALVEDRHPGARVPVVGHRIVHGGPDYSAPVLIDEAVSAALETLISFAPLHQPHNLAGVAAAREAFPEARQLACFDTAFHRSMPWEAETFALPVAYFEKGVRRYGFHGLSYEFVSAELARIAPDRAEGRVAIAHLGNGASICAVVAGRSKGSTMGFTALDGLPMGTRSGQIDPGVLLYLMEQEGMGAAEISDLLYKRSGLLGLSGLSNDMRTLEAAGTPEADRAIAYFTRRIRREIGALAAMMDGLDALVFTGGIGEHSARVREAVVGGLGWFGLVLEPDRNAASEPLITADLSPIPAYVIPTDEEMTIARAVMRVLRGG